MKIKTPRTEKCVLVFALIFLAEYALEHATYLLYDAVLSGSLKLTSSFLSAIYTTLEYIIEATEIITLGAITVIALLCFVADGARGTLRTAGVAVLTKLFYLIPHYYMVLVSDGNDSLEALLLLIPIVLLILLVMSVEIVAAVALGLIPAIRSSKRDAVSWRESIEKDLPTHELLDVGNKVTAAIAIAAAVTVAKSVIMQIVETVMFFVDNGADYSGTDVFILLFDLIYPLFLMVISYLVMQTVKVRTLLTSCDGEDNGQIEDQDQTDAKK